MDMMEESQAKNRAALDKILRRKYKPFCMWPRELGSGRTIVCSGSKYGNHIFARAQMMTHNRHHWSVKCRYCEAVQQISLIPQKDRNYPKIVTEVIYPENPLEKSILKSQSALDINTETGDMPRKSDDK